jgi:hypothetical protein
VKDGMTLQIVVVVGINSMQKDMIILELPKQ